MRMVVQAMTLWFLGRASIGLGPGACSALRTRVRRGRRLPTECTGGARRQAPEKELEGLVSALGESPPPVPWFPGPKSYGHLIKSSGAQ